MSRQLVLIAAFLVLLVVEFTPGCHGKTVMTEDDVDLELRKMAEEESENADGESDDLWQLASRMADLVNEQREAVLLEEVDDDGLEDRAKPVKKVLVKAACISVFSSWRACKKAFPNTANTACKTRENRFLKCNQPPKKPSSG